MATHPGGGYYPHGGPPEFSYTRYFVDHFHSTGTDAEANIMAEGDKINFNVTKQVEALDDLDRIIKAARQAELNFLIKHELTDIGKVDDWSKQGDWTELVRIINETFVGKDAFNRNLQLIKQTTEDKEAQYHNLFTFLGDKLQKATREILEKKGLNYSFEELSVAIVRKAWTLLGKSTDYEIKKENGDFYIDTNPKNKKTLKKSQIQPYKEIINSLKPFKDDRFITSLIDLFDLEKFYQDTVERMRQGDYKAKNGRYKTMPTLAGAVTNGNIKGPLIEIIDAAIAPEIMNALGGSNGHWTSAWTGPSGVKPDAIVYEANFDIDFSSYLNSNEGDQDESKREKHIRGLEQVAEKIKNIANAKGEIVFISDKNYIIQQGRNAYEAQGKVTLDNLKALLDKVESKLDIEALINYLSNIGTTPVRKGNDEDNGAMMIDSPDQGVLTSIATQLGYFLFDDLSIEFGGGINTVHLMNLSGIYMPLSVILTGLKTSLLQILDNEKRVSSFANVSYTSGGIAPTTPWSDETVFTNFREGRMSKSYITVTFMQNLARFLTGQITGNSLHLI